jgi:hypothetical protein
MGTAEADFPTRLRPNIAQDKAKPNHRGPHQAEHREDHQGSERCKKDKPGHLLVEVLDQNDQSWADAHKHDDETNQGDGEEQAAGDFKQQPGEAGEGEEAALFGQAAGFWGNRWLAQENPSTG